VNKKKFIKAEEGKSPGFSVVYYDTDGNKTIRYHNKNGKTGSIAWRNNNPGNLGWGNGEHAMNTGCIGKARGRPVFPDYETGKQSMRLLLKKDFYQRLTLNELPRKYTGVKPEQPDNEEVFRYRTAIRTLTKFDMKRTVKSLSNDEYEKLLKAMETHEGWLEGYEEFIEVKHVIKTRLGKNRVISEFLVGNSIESSWLSKQEAIALAEAGRLLAILVHTKHSVYLRPLFHHISFRKLLGEARAVEVDSAFS